MRRAPDATGVRTLFISDVHLGTAACQADSLLRFLQCYHAETIYLVGDIVEGWRLRRSRSWPKLHLAVMTELLARAQAGVRVIYVPGNHDENLRQFVGLVFGGIEVADTAIHLSASGQRYLVLHGDQHDLVVQRLRWLAYIGDWAYRASLAMNPKINLLRRVLGLPCRSFSSRVKFLAKSLVNTLSRSETLLAIEVKRHRADGVICGHTHHAMDGYVAGAHYINAGDWVESCTGVVEHNDGRFEIVRWADIALAKKVNRERSQQGGACLPEAEVIPAVA